MEFLFGLIILVVVAGAFVLITRYNNRLLAKSVQKWADNAKLVNGQPGRKWYWSGTYDGVPVHWRLSSIGGGEDSNEEYFYNIYMDFSPGGKYWEMFYHRPGLLNRDPEGWHLKCKDKTFAEALQASGITGVMQGASPSSKVTYSDKKGSLNLELQVQGFSYVPSLADFQQQLAILRGAGRLNEKAKQTLGVTG